MAICILDEFYKYFYSTYARILGICMLLTNALMSIYALKLREIHKCGRMEMCLDMMNCLFGRRFLCSRTVCIAREVIPLAWWNLFVEIFPAI